MAWTTPRTWTDTETVNASIMNAHVRDNLDYLYDPGDWTSYTPTVANLSTSTYTATGYYQYVNRSTVAVRIAITINTFAGTGTTAVTVSLPVNCKTTGYTANFSPLGSGLRDDDGGTPVMAIPTYNATGNFTVLVNSATAPQTSRWTLNAPSGQAANDQWFFNLLYEVA